MGDAVDLVIVQRIGHRLDRTRPVGRMGDELGDQRVEPQRNLGPLLDPVSTRTVTSPSRPSRGGR